MPFREQWLTLKQLLRWALLVVPAALIIGSVVAFFLTLLGAAIHFRFNHSWLLYLLPVGGLAIHFIYQSVGKSSEQGNNLIINKIQDTTGGVPWQMAPVILVTTVITHLFGGSAGREGTAVQIGGSMAYWYGRLLKLTENDMRMILTAGMAAGFGAVFGTPLTGAIFAIEVLAIGQVRYDAILPALVAAIVGDITVSAWHVQHTHYQIDHFNYAPFAASDLFHIDLLLLAKVMAASAVFGLASYLFSGMVHEVKGICLRVYKSKWMIPVFGGLVIIALTFINGKPDYLSLGIDAQYPGAITIPSAFQTGGSYTWSWLWKSIYTSVTLGTGFKGGEVTPLFYIGATLGNTLSQFIKCTGKPFRRAWLYSCFFRGYQYAIGLHFYGH